MENSVTTLMVVIATLLISLVVLSLYSFYIPYTNAYLTTTNNLEAISKSVEFSISPLAYKAYLTTKNVIFNVTFLATVSVKQFNGQLILVAFVTKPVANLYYLIPSGNQNATINYNKGLVKISGNVYLPDGKLLGSMSVNGYQLNNGEVFNVSANVTYTEIIVLWVLINYHGEYYRIGYTYITPEDAGIGLFITSSSGNYYGNNKEINVKPPLYFSSNKGLMLGMWFEPYLISDSRSLLANITFYINNLKENVSVEIFTQGNTLYISETILPSLPTTFYPLYSGLKQGQWYFLNFSTGSQLVKPGLVICVTLYTSQGKLLSKQLVSPSYFGLPNLGSGNGYASIVQFGNTTAPVNIISQVVMSSIQSSSNLNLVYNITKQLLINPYYYNNTNNLYWIISHGSGIIYSIGYWYFVSPYYPPPTQINAAIWYYSSNTLEETYLYEYGNNSWIVS
ncbi:hypothetical protein [Sulfurisphaera ohwakuensis]|uniref:Uncharacterized protein n=1 Tax=Sulfurisphaera ohwakuensis TaxID=69656 RepID=A0A650CG08_SULOH|nr:hypothetical protein [Sulfurisphaera ohwakuensis]MBB5254094.1 hypothetical protein [Sulfurisphaera ohwakuensis]QGR16686.1 hypothetical protein D1869_05420 [Sulfurisphaera ohwakuensis]